MRQQTARLTGQAGAKWGGVVNGVNGIIKFMSKFYYVYVLQSGKDHSLYVGHTTDLKRRLEEHNEGKVSSTSDKRPWKLIYWEGCLSRQDTMEREKYFKTTWGKRYIKSRLKKYITGQATSK